MSELELRLVEAALRLDVGATIGFSLVLADRLRNDGHPEQAARLLRVISGEPQATIVPLEGR